MQPGSQHVLHEGALAYHEGVRQRVRKVVKHARLLWVDDAAFDDASLMALRIEARDSFIVRHNLRREQPEVLINLARQEGGAHSPRPGKVVYTGSTIRNRNGVDGTPLFLVWHVEKLRNSDLMPENFVLAGTLFHHRDSIRR